MISEKLVEENAIVTQIELAERLPPKTPPWVAASLMSITGLHELNQAYSKLGFSGSTPTNLFEQALQQLEIRVKVEQREVENVPTTGPTIVIANHPFGGADGLALGAVMLRRRADVRIMTNNVLGRVAKLAPWFLDVDVFEAKRQAHSNARQIRAALKHLQAGGLLVMFPAGEVSRFRPDLGAVADGPWSSTVAMLARRSRATVVPCYFAGANSSMFRAAGLIHPNLGMLLLARELLARRDTEISLKIGRRMSPAAPAKFSSDEVLTAWLRLRTYDLQSQLSLCTRKRHLRPIAEPVDPAQIDWELEGLPSRQLLLQQGRFRVYFAEQSDIPRTLDEIARLRELTFRAVGEGTGGARDLDVFDQTYHHLVLYDTSEKCIAGSYRIAFCDRIIRESGFAGLYTNELFRFKAPMRRELCDAIELGRSFVRPEYQRESIALALLWRGIGELLVRNRSYRRLVGAVSISDRYRGAARRLLVAFLNETRSDRKLGRLVDARRPIQVNLNPEERALLTEHCRRTKDLSYLISELDTSSSRVPVLLERYLDLGARVLSLSVDPAFGDCIDALVLVELERAPEAILRRFMGAEGHAAFAAASKKSA
jgi:putative hemolysin